MWFTKARFEAGQISFARATHTAGKVEFKRMSFGDHVVVDWGPFLKPSGAP
jgi:hypothetical protein